MKKQIELEIQNQKDIYKLSSNVMISAYNRELKIEKDYNGRQLLELLQNADDQESEEVYVELNTINNQLIIANSGQYCEAFSLDGIISLMISDLSSKVTKKYIGNKGLGFRSIINWSNQITINSNNLDIIFSKKIVNSIFDELFTKDEENQFNEKRNLPKGTKPIPFLAIPKVVENSQNQWTTKITVEYKDSFLDDITEQIDDLKDEILLFLNFLHKLTLNVDGNIREVIKKQDNNFIYINNEKWIIYEDEEKLPHHLWEKENEEEYYNLKLALKENYNIKNNLLFAYFPTHITMDFPFIIHGTFELDTPRNSIIKSDKNRYILEKLVLLITKTAKELTQNDVSYKALEFLIYKNKHPTLNTLGFYEQLDNAIEELEIFPCIDNTYRKREDVVYISNDFSNFLQRVNATDLFSNLLISTEKSNIDISTYTLANSVSTEQLNILSQRISTIDDRVDLIHIFYHTFKRENKFLFLIDDKKEFIPVEDKVYTPNLEVHLEIPSYVDIKFIHNELYEKLLLKFESTPQQLVEKLKEMTNIEGYNAKSILNKIVVATNKELIRENIDGIKTIKEMVLSLYLNYKILDTTVSIDAKVQLVAKNKNHNITKAEDLYLSKTYPSGELTEELFSDILKKKQFLVDIDFWEFNEYKDRKDIENFFLWLGVNQYTKFDEKNYSWEYNSFLFDIEPKPENYDCLYNRPTKSIVDFDIIKRKISSEEILVWILKDKYITKELNKIYKIEYNKKRASKRHTYIDNAPSFIFFQFSEIFKDYFLSSNELSKLCNDDSIDFNHSLFKKYKLKKENIKKLMIQMGAIDSFDKLSNKRIKHIVMNLPTNAPDGKGCRQIYRYAYARGNMSWQTNDYKDFFTLDNNISLFATKYQKSAYYSCDEVYYGNKKLPRKILETKAIFDFPKGLKDDSFLPTFFCLQNLDEIKLQIIDKEININKTQEFNSFLQIIFPYILVYLIKDILEEEKKIIIFKKLQKLSIELCDEVVYRVEDTDYALDNNDYIEDNTTYYITIDESLSIQKLREDYDFCDTFSNILNSQFSSFDREVFINILKDSTQFTENAILDKIGKEELYKARKIMGIANEKELFWKLIYKSLNKEYKHKSDNLLDSIKDDLDLKTDITVIEYQDLNGKNSLEAIKELFIELGLKVEDYNNQDPYYQLDFSKYHQYYLSNCFHDNQKNFEQHLYKYCKEQSQERDFLSLLDKYTHNNEVVEDNILDVEYQNIVQQFVKDNFEFNIDNPIDKSIHYQSIYDKNKSEIDFEKIKGQREYDSLLYFDKLDEIKEYVKSLKKEEQPKPNNSPEKPPKPIIENPKTEKPSLPKRQGGKGGRGGTHNPNRDRAKEDKGKNAEKNVVQTLKKEFGEDNVDWVNDDTLGYDIKYKNKQDIWKYVEVKVYSNSKFFLSKNEKRFAEENKDNYEIFLVDDKEIYRLTDIDFYDRDRFILEANDYVVYYGNRKS